MLTGAMGAPGAVFDFLLMKLYLKVYVVIPVGRYILMNSIQQANALTIFAWKACAVADIIRTPFALTLMSGRKG